MISEAIKKFREQRGYPTIKAMADAHGFNASTLSDWESGRKQPSKKSIRLLRDKLGIVTGVADTPSFLDLKPVDDSRSTEPQPALTGDKVSGRPVDALDEGEAQRLLVMVDVVRDPLHGDIRLTGLERHLVDTPSFQRLRNINQLSPTYIAYPGALHTRFLHSLGTLHVCSEMIATCNFNAETYGRLAPVGHPVPHPLNAYSQLLARLCALLHDAAHVPFGHTLEKEGGVFEADEWKDPTRVARLFGDASKPGEFAIAIANYFEREGLSLKAAQGVCEDIKRTLVTSAKDVHKLRYPFVHDLVGNTICADLIDYVQRDALFCGLTETFGKRFLSYLAVIPTISVGDSEQPATGIRFAADTARYDYAPPRSRAEDCVRSSRLVLLQYRYNERWESVPKHDVIAEAIDLVRRRLAVAEKLYFHRTKVVASSMLIDAAQAARLTADAIWECSDGEVIKLLERSSAARARRLSTNVRERRLYKPIFRASYHRPDDSGASENLWNETRGAYYRYIDPKAREELAEELDKLIGTLWGDGEIRPGSATVYCPKREMNEKRFEMLVLSRPDGRIHQLEKTEHPPSVMEIRAIKETHRHLWKIEVFVDPEIVPLDPRDPDVQKFAGAIQHRIGLPNEVDALRNLPTVDLAEWQHEATLERDLVSMGMFDKIRIPDLRRLQSLAYSDDYASLSKNDRVERLRAELGRIGL